MLWLKPRLPLAARRARITVAGEIKRGCWNHHQRARAAGVGDQLPSAGGKRTTGGPGLAAVQASDQRAIGIQSSQPKMISGIDDERSTESNARGLATWLERINQPPGLSTVLNCATGIAGARANATLKCILNYCPVLGVMPGCRSRVNRIALKAARNVNSSAASAGIRIGKSTSACRNTA